MDIDIEISMDMDIDVFWPKGLSYLCACVFEDSKNYHSKNVVFRQLKNLTTDEELWVDVTSWCPQTAGYGSKLRARWSASVTVEMARAGDQARRLQYARPTRPEASH